MPWLKPVACSLHGSRAFIHVSPQSGTLLASCIVSCNGPDVHVKSCVPLHVQAELYRYHDGLAQWRSRQSMNSSSSNGKSEGRDSSYGKAEEGSSSNSSSSRSRSTGQEGPPSPPLMPEPLLTVHAYGTLVDGYMRAANATAAEEVVQRMRREVGGVMQWWGCSCVTSCEA
eukprot:scaffold100998_cov18-Tisochrysis_lutea.AAC.1